MKHDEFILMMAEVLEVDASDVDSASSLFDFPAYDSVCALTLMVRLEEDAGVTCPPGELAALKTVGDVEKLISRHAKS